MTAREDMANAALAVLWASKTSLTEADALLRAFADESEALQLVPLRTTLDDFASGLVSAAPGFFSSSGLSMFA